MAGTAESGGVADERVPTVVVDDVHVHYTVVAGSGGLRSVRTVEALKGISFAAYEGESIGILGRNGSGKSTLLRAIAGLVPTVRGTVYASAAPQLLGVNAALINDLTGERNVMLGGLALGLSPAQVREKYAGIVEFAGLGEYIDLPLRAYSSGMGARLRFAIATAAIPHILLIDEALATGDADFRERSEERIGELREEAATIFVVSHSLSTIENSCTRAIWIDRGVQKLDGSVEEVIDAYRASIPSLAGKKKPDKKQQDGAQRPEPGPPAAPTPLAQKTPRAAVRAPAPRPATAPARVVDRDAS